MPKQPEPNITRFERWWTPEPNSGCWLWLGSAPSAFGYGAFSMRLGVNNYREIDAHRAAWQLYRGEIPVDLCVLHKCDVPLCVNPHHLFIGTKGDNARDAIAKGRPWADRGRWTHCKNGHPLTDRLPNGQRRCRICMNAYARKWQKTEKGRAIQRARPPRTSSKGS